MKTKMDVCITITPASKSRESKSRELYERLKPFKANVTDLNNKVYVYTEIDIREDTIEKILAICNEYGDCEVNAQTK